MGRRGRKRRRQSDDSWKLVEKKAAAEEKADVKEEQAEEAEGGRSEEKSPLKLVLKIKNQQQHDDDEDEDDQPLSAFSPRKQKAPEESGSSAGCKEKEDAQTQDQPQAVQVEEPRVEQINLSDKQKKALLVLLNNLLKDLELKDPQKIFRWPVNDMIAPGYSQWITEPMDFSTMRNKIENSSYNSYNEFKSDLNLMIANCKYYNVEGTIYHKAAKRLKGFSKKILAKERLYSLRQELQPLRECFTLPEYCSMLGVPTPDETDAQPEQNDTLMTDLTAVNSLDQNDLVVSESEQPVADDAKAGALLILNPDQEVPPSKRTRLYELTAFMDDGIDALPPTKVDKRNKITPVEYLNYGAFCSFAPTYDSRNSNITQHESDMLLATYGGSEPIFGGADTRNLTTGARSDLQLYVDDMLSSRDLGPRTAQQRLNDNAVLLHDLNFKQNRRLSAAMPPGKANLKPPCEAELSIADRLQYSLLELSRHAMPGQLYEEEAVRACHE